MHATTMFASGLSILWRLHEFTRSPSAQYLNAVHAVCMTTTTTSCSAVSRWAQSKNTARNAYTVTVNQESRISFVCDSALSANVWCIGSSVALKLNIILTCWLRLATYSVRPILRPYGWSIFSVPIPLTLYLTRRDENVSGDCKTGPLKHDRTQPQTIIDDILQTINNN